ncbi:MAG: MFS transporter [Candidatus Vecturithrix sp.]|jgi:MFS family permease|nr:MFS transporter [Candidatus Vecturithrix sp.]
MVTWLRPQERINEIETRTGLAMLLNDGVCTQVMNVLTGGAFLIAFALHLGASNVVIGLLAAMGPMAQVLQIASIFLIERSGLRKAAVVLSTFGSRLFWPLIAAIPWFMPRPWRIVIFLSCLLLFFSLGSISNLAFNSWMQDFVPVGIRGDYFGKRSAIATAAGVLVSLLAAVGVDFFSTRFPEVGIYSVFFLIGAAVGFLGVYFLTRIPEPQMVKTHPRGLLTILTEPFQDANFRQLLFFLGWWNCIYYLATPFFTVYMLKRIGLSMTIVLGLSVLSQIANALFYQLWGRLADRFSNKSVLAVTTPLFILSIFLFPFTTMPEKYVMTMPFLILIHGLSGIATAGVLLCTGNIALKLAPHGKATPYLAASALMSGIAATIAPILGGLAADWYAQRELSLTLRWLSQPAERVVDMLAMDLRGLDFLFMIAAILGVYTLHRLSLVQEIGDAEEEIVLTEFYGIVRRAFRHVSTVAGMRYLFDFPYSRLITVFSEENLPPREDDEEHPASPGLLDIISIKKKLGLHKNR